MSYIGRTGKLSQRAYNKVSFLATAGQTIKTGLSYVAGFVEVYLNGVLLTDTVDYTATNGNSVTFVLALNLDDEITIISLKTFVAANMLSLSGGTITGDLGVVGTVTAGEVVVDGAALATGAFTTVGTASTVNTGVTTGTLPFAEDVVLIQPSGNVGIGTVPDAWKSTWRALDVGVAASLYSQDGNTAGLASNVYFNGTNWIHKNTGAVAFYQQNEGSHIFYNAASGTAGATLAPVESARLDSAGNLLVGTTQTDVGYTDSGSGISLDSGGYIQAARSSVFPVMYLNKLDNDGEILQLRKDGATVGSIGTKSGNINIGGGDTGLYFDPVNDAIRPWSTTDSDIRDNAISFGTSSSRFKDLYLSGGVYLGGTGAANKLDDYEEGTFTPSVATGTLSFGGATYIKIGNQVTVNLDNVGLSDITSTTAITINNMPFTNGSYACEGSVMIARKDTTESVTAHIASNTSNIYFYANSTGNFSSLRHNALNSVSNSFYITITYIAA